MKSIDGSHLRNQSANVKRMFDLSETLGFLVSAPFKRSVLHCVGGQPVDVSQLKLNYNW